MNTERLELLCNKLSEDIPMPPFDDRTRLLLKLLIEVREAIHELNNRTIVGRVKDWAWNVRAWFFRKWDRLFNKDRSYWHYCIYKNYDGLAYNICEVHADADGIWGWTGEITPYGDTVDQLILDLEMMLEDAKKCKRQERMVVATSKNDGYVIDQGKKVTK